jgi:hypothetical protein
MRGFTLDDLRATLFFCVLVPLVGMALLVALLPVYVGVVVWVLHLLGVA